MSLEKKQFVDRIDIGITGQFRVRVAEVFLEDGIPVTPPKIVQSDVFDPGRGFDHCHYEHTPEDRELIQRVIDDQHTPERITARQAKEAAQEEANQEVARISVEKAHAGEAKKAARAAAEMVTAKSRDDAEGDEG